jgi:2-oxoglutarate ferredoxin oxidoreductase subunit beta
MAIVFQKPKSLSDAVLHYCPGCPHGIIHRLVAEAIDNLGIEGEAIGVAPVGCAVMAYDYFNCDMIEAAHGRAPRPPASSVAVRTTSSLPTRETATWPPSAWRRRSMPPPGMKILPSFSSTTPFTA